MFLLHAGTTGIKTTHERTNSFMQFAEVTLDLIEPSSSNPRRHRNKLEDVDLMASISSHGILTPLLVRPMTEQEKYQIAAGHRRYVSLGR